LESKDFPYNFKELGATIVVPSALTSSQQGPQAYYMDNVFPTSRGYASVSFTGHIPAIPGLATPLLDCFKITSADGSLAYLAITATQLWVFDANYPVWTVRRTFPSSLTPISFANVRGEFYVYVPSLYEILKYDFASSVFASVSLLGIDMTDVSGISDSGDRMLMYSYGQIYWSSVFDALDFVPSLSTGAGSSSILAIKSVITTVVSLGQDFIIYTTQNAVGARATGDFNFPYVFSEIVGSSGAASLNHVAYNSNSQVHVVWTYSGFQEVTTQSAKYIFPELSDGILSGVRFNYLQGAPVLERLPKLDVLVRFSSNRWLCVSTKDSSKTFYSDCYVLDTLLGRWGKLTVQHSALLEYWPISVADRFTYDDIAGSYATYNDFVDNYRETFGVDLVVNPPIPGDNFGIVTPAGAIFTVAPSDTANYRGGILGITAEVSRIIFGRFKLTRDAGVRLEEVRLSELKEGGIAAFSHAYSGEINRKHSIWQAHPVQTGVWTGVLIGDSISFEVTGVFRINSLELGLFGAGKLNLPLSNTHLQYVTVMVETANVFADQQGVVDVPIPVNLSSVPQSS
jgi:hypothetical protein